MKCFTYRTTVKANAPVPILGVPDRVAAISPGLKDHLEPVPLVPGVADRVALWPGADYRRGMHRDDQRGHHEDLCRSLRIRRVYPVSAKLSVV